MIASRRMHQQRLVGAGALRRLEEVPEFFESRHIMLIRGRQSFELSGAAAVLSGMMAHQQVRQFTGEHANPTLEDLERGLSCLAEGPCHVIIAVGGGACLDMAKLLSACAVRPGDAIERIREGRQIEHVGPPIIAVPTTSGSGSEATHFAVVYVAGVKRSVAHPALRPAAAIVDSELTASLCPRQTAISGLDAFAQALESYWSVRSTRQSKRWSRRALQLILRHLVAAVNDPHEDDRDAMAEAAHLAGRAIDTTRTTACHAMSYPLTAGWGVPHGLAVALTLGPVYSYNHEVRSADVVDARGSAFVRRSMRELDRVLDVGGGAEAEACIRELLSAVGLPATLAETGVDPRAARAAMTEGVNAERLDNNPRRMTEDAMRRLLEGI